MRVIAGTAGGIRLEVPKNDIRPTMDRVKAAIFSSLGDRVIGAKVLDLFAGTGALGIEALSRGAAAAEFVENDRNAITALERNLAKTNLAGRIRSREVFDYLAQTSGRGLFDLVFADPPYAKSKSGEIFTESLLRHKQLPLCLTPNGIFILEKRPAERLPATDLWNVIRQKRYGATETIFLQRRVAGEK